MDYSLKSLARPGGNGFHVLPLPLLFYFFGEQELMKTRTYILDIQRPPACFSQQH